jgi:SMC interacting uncharacterized protein involved in chromosome segregation
MSEHSADQNPEVDQNPVDINELTSKLEAISQQLETEKASKERILEESKKYKEGLQTFKAKEEEARNAQRAKEEERLIKEGQFSTIIEQREQRIKELMGDLDKYKNEVQSRDTAIVNFKKAAAFERAIGGKMKKEAYWNHVDFDKIAINPETGKIDDHSLKTAADGFIDEYKELVSFGSSANLPNGTPSGSSSGKLTHAQWKMLPESEKPKRMKDVID